jgi:restriction endonuclease S subunit
MGNLRWSTKALVDCIERVKVPGKVPRASFLDKGSFPVISQEADFINGYWNDEADLVKLSEPVVIFGDHTQVLKLIDFDFVVGADGVKILKPKHFLDARFLRFYLEANPFPSLGYARHYRHISTLEVPLPPLEEQKRIVAVLDQAFAALDRARGQAEANLADAKELKNCCVESELSSEVLGAPEPVGPHVDLLTGFAFKSSGYSEDSDDIRIVRGDNIVQGEFRWEGVKRWPINERDTYKKYELARDDVLIAMDRTWISAGIKYAIVDDAALPSLLVQRVARLRSKPSVLPRYLGYWIGSKVFEKYVLSIQTGLGVPHVSGVQIENFFIRIPSTSVQEAVLDRLDGLMERQNSLVLAYERKLTDLANLRQSLLQKAFSGQL